MALFERNHTFLNDTLPSARTVPFVVLGVIIAFQSKYYPVDILPRKEESLMLVLDGMLILSLVLHDIYQRWMFFFCNPSRWILKWALKDIITGTFKRYWRRYLATFCISVLLIGGGLIGGG